MLTAIEFNSLPEASIEAGSPLEGHLAKDLTLGGKVQDEHAREMLRAGVTPVELERLPEVPLPAPAAKPKRKRKRA